MITLEKGYLFSVAQFDEYFYDNSLAAAFLHSEEIKRISKAVSKRRSEFLAARILAKKAYLDLSKADHLESSVLIKNDARGAPFFEDGNYRLSLTHDGNIAAAFVCEKSSPFVGIDVEQISEDNAEVILKYISTDERAVVENISEVLGNFAAAAAIWTAKEAMSKYLGLGFSVFDSLTVSDITCDNVITVNFSNYKGFGALIKFCGSYCFAFAAKKSDFSKLGLNKLAVTPKPINDYIKSTSETI